jgi:GTP-binding protein YchF
MRRMLQAGIVGLPNVGKSTLFNALTRSRKADAKNYPFCTIDPNVGVIEVPDARLNVLAELSQSGRIIPAAMEIVDIAGLVAGASRGEGLGNKFLANIREVDAVVHVVRCFEDSNIVHTSGGIDPLRDIEIINTELLLADLQSVEGQLEKNLKKAKGNSAEAKENIDLLRLLAKELNGGNFAISVARDEFVSQRLKAFNLLTAKPVIFACNVDESSMVSAGGSNAFVEVVRGYAASHGGARVNAMCAQIESDLCDLSEVEAAAFLAELGVVGSGVSQLIGNIYETLGLASFFTTGEDETRAWTFRVGMKAPQCAGVIHGDFEAGFIRTDVVPYGELVTCGSWNSARDSGKIRSEGKDYAFRDGDVALFRFEK